MTTLRLLVLLGVGVLATVACGSSGSSKATATTGTTGHGSTASASGATTSGAASTGASSTSATSSGAGGASTSASVSASGTTASTSGAGGSESDGGAATLCTRTGGTVQMMSCCSSVSDFPSTCTVGGCSCSPGNSHMVETCACPPSQCYDPTLGCMVQV